MNKFRLTGFYLLVTLMAALTACGGGDGDNALDLPSVSDYQLQLTLLAQDSDAEIDVVTNTDSGRLRITLLDPDGIAAANQTISLTVSNARLEGSSVQSDEDGMVEITVFAGAGGPAAASIVAEYTDPEGSLAQADVSFETLGDESDVDTPTPVIDIEFDIGATISGNFQIGALNIGAAANGELAANSTTLITAELRNSIGDLITTPTVVNFSSPCAIAGETELDSEVTSVNGTAEATYRPTGCAGSDEITATVSTATTELTATAIVVIASAPAASLQFISATPADIAVKGAGGADRQDFSILLFRVVDSLGSAVSAQEIEFSLQTLTGGVNFGFDSDTNQLITSTSALSDEDGEVRVTVFSGNTPAVVVVIAEFSEGTTVITEPSNELTISAAPPVQGSMDISFESLNPNSYHISGIENRVTVSAADRYSNHIPDGTAVFFTTEGGTIDPSCLTLDGRCSVIWRSQDPRGPANPDVEEDRNGRITVLAYMGGEEKFVDENSDGLFNNDGINSEVFYNIGEAFIDFDENGEQSGTGINFERYIDSNFDGSYTQEDTVFQGLSCDKATADLGHCTNLATIFDSGTIIMSSHIIDISICEFIDQDTCNDLGANPTLPLTGNTSFVITIADENGNSAPQGTDVKIEIDGADLAFDVNHTIGGNSTEPEVFTLRVESDEAAVSGATINLTITAEIDITRNLNSVSFTYQ